MIVYAVAVLVHCGGSSGSGPSAPTSIASVGNRISLTLSPGGVGNYSLAGQVPSAQIWPCYQFVNHGPGSANLSLTLTPIGADGSLYSVTNNSHGPEPVAVEDYHTGCGIPTAQDFDSVHPEAVRYRLRLDATFGDGVTGSIEQESSLQSTLGPKASGIVISEFRLRGPRGTDDQFIELQNVTSAPLVMSNWSLDTWSQSTATRVFAAAGITATLSAGCHYLLEVGVQAAISEGIQPDNKFFAPVSDTGGFAIRDAYGRVIDEVGLDPTSVFREGAALTPLVGDANRGYARNGPDSNDNARDFVVVTPSHPENSKMCSLPAPLPSLINQR